MSPETIRGKGYDWKSDVWSMGCILYEMAMLRAPFKGNGDMKMIDLFHKIMKVISFLFFSNECNPLSLAGLV